MNKPTIAFVFFGLNRTTITLDQQFSEIDIVIEKFREIANFKLIDCTSTGLNNSKFERMELKGLENAKNISEKYDPLAKYRDQGKRLSNSGPKNATIFLQAKQLNEFVEKRTDIDFVFRFRVELLIDQKLISKAIKNVLLDNNKSPFKVLKHKAWIQFFHLVEPFFIMDTAFLISSFDLKKLSYEAINAANYFKPISYPSQLWGPLFFKQNNFLSILASNFFREGDVKRPSLFDNINANILPLYWKYINANFYVNYEPNIPIYWAWNPKRGEKRSWLNLKRKWALKLSINQIVLIYKLCDYCYLEENLSYEDISIICKNKDNNINGIIIIFILILKKIFQRINRIKLRIIREIKNIRVNL